MGGKPISLTDPLRTLIVRSTLPWSSLWGYLVQYAGMLFQLLYLCAALASLAAVTAILRRLGYGLAIVAMPAAATALIIVALQVISFFLMGFPPFAFGIVASAMPALMVVPPACIVVIAFSRRLRK